jgi:hypothetical protein
MGDFFRSIFEGIRDLITRNPVAGYLTLALFIAAIVVALSYLFKRLKSNYLKLLAPLGQTLPLPLIILFQNQINESLGSEITIILVVVFILYIFLTHIIYNNLIPIEAGKSSSGQWLIILLGLTGLAIWIYLAVNLFYGFEIPESPTPPPPEVRPS